MIYPDAAQLMAGIAEALKDSVLPELARGTTARRQLQAAIEILRHLAFAAPHEAGALAADNADMAEMLDRAECLLSSAPSPPPNPPPSRGRGKKRSLPHHGGGTSRSEQRSEEALPLDGGGLGGGDAIAEPAQRNLALQGAVAELQSRLAELPQDLRAQISALLVDLHKRMTDRALALIPPPVERTPRPAP